MLELEGSAHSWPQTPGLQYWRVQSAQCSWHVSPTLGTSSSGGRIPNLFDSSQHVAAAPDHSTQAVSTQLCPCIFLHTQKSFEITEPFLWHISFLDQVLYIHPHVVAEIPIFHRLKTLKKIPNWVSLSLSLGGGDLDLAASFYAHKVLCFFCVLTGIVILSCTHSAFSI